jgi:hypothetical protein
MVAIATGLYRQHAVRLVVWGTRCGPGSVIIHLPNMGVTVSNMARTKTEDPAAWNFVQVRCLGLIYNHHHFHQTWKYVGSRLFCLSKKIEEHALFHTYVLGESYHTFSSVICEMLFSVQTWPETCWGREKDDE